MDLLKLAEQESKKEEKPKESTGRGIPMDEEGIRDWQKAFTDIEESIELLYKR